MRQSHPQLVISVLRLDGDMYESTMDELYNLYDLVAVGGFVIIDDWAIGVCQKAVVQFRGDHSITDEIVKIDDISVYWRKTKQIEVNYEWWLTYNTSRGAE